MEIKQQYVNSLANPLECVYVFPKHDDAAITSLEVQIGDKKVIGSFLQISADFARRNL